MGSARAVPAYALSAVLHAGALAAIVSLPAAPAGETVAIEVVEIARPAPPPPPQEVAPPAPAPEPPPALPRRLPKRPPALAPPRDAPLAEEEAPPPPNAPPPEAAPAPRAPVRIGVAMSATTEGGTIAAPAGNTLYGEMPREAPDREDATAYRAEGAAPPTRPRRLPGVVAGDIPRSEYPESARRARVEGVVRLRIVLADDGRVAEASILDEPGHGLGAAAVAAAKRHLRFEAPGRSGEVLRTFVYKIRWELD